MRRCGLSLNLRLLLDCTVALYGITQLRALPTPLFPFGTARAVSVPYAGTGTTPPLRRRYRRLLRWCRALWRCYANVQRASRTLRSQIAAPAPPSRRAPAERLVPPQMPCAAPCRTTVIAAQRRAIVPAKRRCCHSRPALHIAPAGNFAAVGAAAGFNARQTRFGDKRAAYCLPLSAAC